MSSSSSLDLSDTIRRVADSVGYPTLKPKQEKATCIVSFVSGIDVFVSLPTGYGKSPCFGLKPRVARSGKEEYSASRVSLSCSVM